MTRLGEPVPEIISEIRHQLSNKLKSLSIKEVDASSIVTGRDFLMKIWYQILSVPIGIGIVDESMSAQTMSNIFYEVGVWFPRTHGDRFTTNNPTNRSNT